MVKILPAGGLNAPRTGVPRMLGVSGGRAEGPVDILAGTVGS